MYNLPSGETGIMKRISIAFVLTLLLGGHDIIAANILNQQQSSITLIFNQPRYSPGDTAFFSGFLSASIVNPHSKRQIVSLLIYGHDQTKVVHRRYAFEEGSGFGHMIIPKRITPGVYTLVGYIEDYVSPLPVFFTAPFIVAGRDQSYDRAANSSNSEQGQFDLQLAKEEFSTRDAVEVSIVSVPEGNKASKYAITVFKDELFPGDAREFNSHIVRLMAREENERKVSHSAARSLYYFRGRALNGRVGQPVPDSTHITFYLNDNDFVFGVYTRKNGEFEFPLFSDFGDEEVFYTIWKGERHLKEAVIELHNPEYAVETVLYSAEGTDPYGTYTYQKNVLMSSYQFYQSLKPGLSRPNESNQFQDNDIEVDLDKYEPFKTMGDVFSNIIPMVKLRRSKDEASLRVFIQKDAMYAGGNPAFIVDGIMTDNIDYVLSLDPGKVKRVGVLRTEYVLNRFGKLGVNGIVAIETRIGDHQTDMPRSRNTFYVTGITKPVIFSQVDHPKDGPQVRVPDLRACLYWNPSLVPSQSGDTRFRFFTSDDTGHFSIFVHRSDADGIPRVVHRRFIVRYP